MRSQHFAAQMAAVAQPALQRAQAIGIGVGEFVADRRGRRQCIEVALHAGARDRVVHPPFAHAQQHAGQGRRMRMRGQIAQCVMQGEVTHAIDRAHDVQRHHVAGTMQREQCGAAQRDAARRHGFEALARAEVGAGQQRDRGFEIGMGRELVGMLVAFERLARAAQQRVQALARRQRRGSFDSDGFGLRRFRHGGCRFRRRRDRRQGDGRRRRCGTHRTRRRTQPPRRDETQNDTDDDSCKHADSRERSGRTTAAGLVRLAVPATTSPNAERERAAGRRIEPRPAPGRPRRTQSVPQAPGGADAAPAASTGGRQRTTERKRRPAAAVHMTCCGAAQRARRCRVLQ
ncbi:hypothetical protein ACFJIW_05810 [Tahibacter sp. UC22_41]|uniref:hypothetical protein n=1 Tax=Tahibacter sp. UC22_41 TaxID=3350178 RepID=UPI0036DBC87A